MPNNSPANPWDQYLVADKPSIPYEWSKYEDNTPSEQQQSQQAPQGFWSKLPANMKAGLAGLGRNVSEMALSGVKGIEGLGQVGQQAMEQLPGPHPTMASNQPYSQQGQQALNQLIPMDYSTQYGPKNPTMMDSMIQGGITHAPELAVAARLARAGLKALPHFTQRGAAKNLNLARNQFENRLPAVQQDQSLQDMIDASVPYLDKTKATQRMIQEARGGQFEPMFSTASQLGSESRALQKSPLASERRIFREPQEARQDILGRLEQHARFHGEDEAADLLNAGLNDYRRYVKFKEKVVPVLKKIGVPTTVLAAVTAGYRGGKKLIND
tara:strand:- start:265 stop:1245 length:981 start_codon:yes stop_codon:yes gene_type:complete